MSFKQKPKEYDDYLDNLFVAVLDVFWDMVIKAKISEKEARKLIMRDVNLIIDESLRQFKSGKIQ